MFISSFIILPEVGLKNPFKRLAIVVLPLPDDPTKATLSPLFILKLILSNIFDSP